MVLPQRKSSGNKLVAAGLVCFGLGMALFPLVYVKNGPTLTYKEGGLSGQAIIRGAYVNTASKDVGRDPDYQKYRTDPIEGNAPLHPEK